ncbi:MAG: outer membrane beta-barrel protein [Prevotella sp.]|nr:outer membrane beta-barrel protein [Prevotella sp.]
MKKIKFFVAVAALMVCSTASAQFTSSSRSNSSVNTEGWNDIYVQYNIVKNGAYDDLDKDTKKEVSGTINGFSVGYNKAINISPSMPLFLLIGGAFEYNFKSEDYTESHSSSRYEYEYSGNAISLKVPVSVTYHFDLSDQFGIEPFAGLNARYYISGKIKEEWSRYYNDKLEKSDSEEGDPFDKDDAKNPANRFIIGGQIGVTAVFSNQFTATLSFDHDLTKIHDDLDDKCYRINIGIGYRF